MDRYIYRDEKELLEDALRRAYRMPSGDDNRFQKLLDRIREASSGRERAA